MSGSLFRLERVDSVLDAIHDRAAAGAPAGTVVVAGEQLAGRGARGDIWHSPPGGLWLSILLRPVVPVGVAVLSLRTGLAAATVLERATGGESIGLKWPNDLILRDRKLGGILCEARWQGDRLGWIAVGVGINVANPVPEEVRDTAIALSAVAPGVEPDDLVPGMVEALRSTGEGEALLGEEERAAYERRDCLAGRLLTAPVVGTARGITRDGALLVDTGSGAVAVRTGHVIVSR